MATVLSRSGRREWRGLAAALAGLLLSACAGAQTPLEAARGHRAEHGAAILAEYAELLAIPNVASDHANIGRNAVWLREALLARGAQTELLELAGAPPLVYGRIEAPGATRTLGIYLHYDGQPVSPQQWAHPPWEPTLYDASMEAGGTPRAWPAPGEAIDPEWRIYARAAGDDKAPAMALLAALDALVAAELAPSSNLVFLFEGEEEAGSPHLRAYMQRFRERLRADLWLIFDGPLHPSGRPQLVFGVRGITSLEITVYGAARNLHSGHYGNWAPNPGMQLARLLASMKDAEGNVVIEGFYASVAPLGAQERAALDALPDYDAALKQELGLAWTEGGGARLEERLLLPSLNVRGLASAEVGDRARNVIPLQATAALDIRLVKGNEPVAMQERVEAHVRAQGYHVVREEPDHATRLAHPHLARIERGGGYRAARTRMDHPLVPVLRAAAAAAAGQPVLLTPSLGGSLPLYLFEEQLEAPVIIVPIANHDDNQHAPNENLRLANLWYGIDLFAGILTLPD